MKIETEHPLNFLPETMRQMLSPQEPPVSEESVQRYVEAALPLEEHERIQRRIGSDPELRQRVIEMRHRLFANRSLPALDDLADSMAAWEERMETPEAAPEVVGVVAAAAAAWTWPSVVWGRLRLGIRQMADALEAARWELDTAAVPTLGGMRARSGAAGQSVNSAEFVSSAGDRVRVVLDGEVLRFYLRTREPWSGPLKLYWRPGAVAEGDTSRDEPILPTANLRSGEGDFRVPSRGTGSLVVVLLDASGSRKREWQFPMERCEPGADSGVVP